MHCDTSAMRHIDMDAIIAQRNGGYHAPKLAVVYPWQSPFFYTRCVESLLHLQHPPGYEVDYFRGTGWSPALRHINGCEQAMGWGADYIVIVGADQLYEPDMLCRLVARMEEGYEAVACMVPTRGFLAWNHGMKPFGKVAWRFKPSTDGFQTKTRQYRGQAIDADMLGLVNPADGDMQLCHMVGSGVIMFRREHLEALHKPWFYESIDPLTQQRWASMDTRFSFRLQWEAGARLWVDTSIKIRHLHIFAIDDSFPGRFEDWATPHPDADQDICKYLPTAFPDSTMADDAPEKPTLPSAFFDNYRAKYVKMAFAEHQQVYNTIERIYPEQRCYDREAVVTFLEKLITHGVIPFVLELGGWKGELARDMLEQWKDMRVISGWYNVEICREAVAKTICHDSRYTCNTLDGFFWDVKPGWVQMCNTLVLSHVVEHMRLQDFAATITHCADRKIDYVYLDIPHITADSRKAWQGWTNTHVLEGGWDDIEAILVQNGYVQWAVDNSSRCYASKKGMRALDRIGQEQKVYVNA